MSRRDLSEADALARAMGLHTIDELAGSDERTQRFAADMEALDRNLYSLPPLNGRAELKDPLTDDPTWRELHGEPTGASFAELSQRYEEWSDLARRASYAEPAAAEPQRQDEGDGEIAERLWGAFRSTYPALARDERAVEQAAETIMQRGGFTTEQQFIDLVAAELDAPDGRTVTLTPSAPGATRRGQQAESDMIAELHAMQRRTNIY